MLPKHKLECIPNACASYQDKLATCSGKNKLGWRFGAYVGGVSDSAAAIGGEWALSRAFVCSFAGILLAPSTLPLNPPRSHFLPPFLPPRLVACFLISPAKWMISRLGNTKIRASSLEFIGFAVLMAAAV